MNHDDVDQVEAALGFRVPASYRREVVDGFDTLPTACLGYEFSSHPAYLISDNRAIREGTAYGIAWPDEYFIIGGDGSGGYFCIDRGGDDPPVTYFDHENQSFRKIADSLRSWIANLSEKET